MSQQLRRHETLPDLSTPDDLGVPDSHHDGLGLPSHPTDIADPQIFMLSEAIKQTLSPSFNGLQSILSNISTQMERIASRPLPIHAHRADDRISLQTPTSTHARVSPHRHRTATSADGSLSPSSYSGGGGGGGVFKIAGETYPRKMRIVMQLVCFLRRISLSLYCHKWGANSEYSMIV